MNLKRFYDAANAAEARVQQLATQINDHFENGQTDEALKLRPELDGAKGAAKDAQQLYISMQAATVQDGDSAGQRFVPTSGDPEPKKVKDILGSQEYTKAFFDAFRAGVSPKTIKAGIHRADQFGMLMNALTETGGSPAGEDGGFLLPVDFNNMITELMRSYVDLATSVNIENVTAYSGWRAIEQAAAALPFAAMTENYAMAEAEAPKFDKIEYTIVDYGGYLPVSNDLLADTPVNIMAYLARWFAKKTVLTNNTLILALINALTPTAITDYKTTLTAIKTCLNKTLDPAVSASASIFTNQSGLEVMDQLEDGTGRPLLQPDVTNETAFRVKGRPVVVLPDTHWANLSAAARSRIAIGDGRAYATLFRRSAFEMAATTIGGDAWRYNNTEVRGIMRADAVEMDASAMKLLTVVLP
jgi:HK97 family phage major capsid protein